MTYLTNPQDIRVTANSIGTSGGRVSRYLSGLTATPEARKAVRAELDELIEQATALRAMLKFDELCPKVS